MEKSKHILCEYGRCGGNGLSIAKKPWLARCKLKVDSRTVNCCESCVDFIIRDGRDNGKDVKRIAFDTSAVITGNSVDLGKRPLIVEVADADSFKLIIEVIETPSGGFDIQIKDTELGFCFDKYWVNMIKRKIVNFVVKCLRKVGAGSLSLAINGDTVKLSYSVDGKIVSGCLVDC